MEKIQLSENVIYRGFNVTHLQFAGHLEILDKLIEMQKNIGNYLTH
jgi:hypothetical protein